MLFIHCHPTHIYQPPLCTRHHARLGGTAMEDVASAFQELSVIGEAVLYTRSAHSYDKVIPRVL